ncbi:alpha/beta-hydrolase [Auriculariales sp. MPI-PUGE-AT-0066]|nr:alpha/beta-hydrolase [Auriculariales sp. MPI-PUGE-AT-0066]
MASSSSNPITAPYGTWKSDITPDVLIQGAQTNELIVDPVTHLLYVIEARPSEAGRCVIVSHNLDGTERKDVFGADWNARSGVHEYGGAAGAAYGNVLYFSERSNGRIHRIDLNEQGARPTPITPDSKVLRFGDFAVRPSNPTHLVQQDVVNTLRLIDADTSTMATLASGADFYASPRWSPNGQRLAWIEWYHPDMPWEGTLLKVANVTADGAAASNTIHIAGNKGVVSVQQPSWVDDNTLVFLSDESGFWAPFIYSLLSQTATALLARSDFAEPQWKLGSTTYAVLDGDSIIFAQTSQGFHSLWHLSLQNKSWSRLEVDYVDIEAVRKVDERTICFRGWKLDSALAIVKLVVDKSRLEISVIQPPSSRIDPDDLARPQGMTLKTDHGQPLHVIYQAPKNKSYIASAESLPPCIIHAHGGLDFLTSVAADVRLRERLNSTWGIVDVNDCVEAVRILGQKGLIDLKRVAIRGGSAGGYTVLQSVCTHPSVFAAATSCYGISDLAALEEDTHKFESRQLEKLVGGTTKTAPKVYKDRSPVTHASKIVTPLLILQGKDDRVVPPNQAKIIVEAIEERHGDVEYKEYEGEGHGWGKVETITDALLRELAFYEAKLLDHKPHVLA